MIFKRRQAKPAKIGDIASIKTDVLSKMVDSEDYLLRSVSYNREIVGNSIRTSHLQKKNTCNTVFAADVQLFYIKDKSVFSNNVVEAVPLLINHDEYGYAIKKVLGETKTFLIPRNALSFSTDSYINEIVTGIPDRILNYVKNAMLNNYDISGFQWVNK